MAGREPALATSAWSPSPRTFMVALLLLVTLGAGTRVWFAEAVAPGLPLPGDAKVYRSLAENLAEGRGLSMQGIGTTKLRASAEHPPAFPAVLAALDRSGADGLRAQRTALAVLTSVSVLLMGLLGRRVAGPMVGLLAAGIAAVHPLWTQSAGLIMSESLHLVLVPAVLLVALDALRRPSLGRAAALGAMIGVAGLVRPEALGLVVVVGLPALISSSARWRERALRCSVLLMSTALVVTPWLLRNERELGTPTMSTNAGKTLLGSNCDASYSGPGLGGFDYECFFGAATALLEYGREGGEPWDGVSFDREMGAAGRRFIVAHRAQLPKVIAARAVRMWGLGFSEDQLRFDVGEGRDERLQRVGQIVHLGLMPFALAGAIALARRQKRELGVLAGPILLVTLTVVLVYGGTRMRTGAEPSVAVLSGVGAVAAAHEIRGRIVRRRPPDAGAADDSELP